jgi:hypothetical protein
MLILISTHRHELRYGNNELDSEITPSQENSRETSLIVANQDWPQKAIAKELRRKACPLYSDETLLSTFVKNDRALNAIQQPFSPSKSSRTKYKDVFNLFASDFTATSSCWHLHYPKERGQTSHFDDGFNNSHHTCSRSE